MARDPRNGSPLSSLLQNALDPRTPFRVMGRLVRPQRKGPGTPPGTVVHTGPRRVEKPAIRAIRFGPEHFDEVEWATLPGSLDVPAPGEGVLWINVDGLHDVALLERLGEAAGIHPLALEDVASVGQRPKLEDYDDHLFIVLHMLEVDDEAIRIADEQVSLVVGPGYLVSFQEAPGDVFEPVRDRLRAGKGKVRSRGSDYLAYALIDALVDSYFRIIERLGERTEELEADAMESHDRRLVQRVHELKRELLVLRRSIWPLREMVAGFLRVEGPLVHPSTKVYLRDVHDHAYQLIEAVEVLRDIASGIRDLHLSNASNRTNEVMKVLTIMASIFIPLTFVAGVYGMNFEYMPELEVWWAYPGVLLLMLILSMGMLWMFRRKGWM